MPLSTSAIILLVISIVLMVATISALFYFGCWKPVRPLQPGESRRGIDLEAQRSARSVNGAGPHGGGESEFQGGSGGRVFNEAGDGFVVRSLRGASVVAK
jgi:hypothetical protein